MPRLPAFPLLLLLSISSALALRLCSFNVRSFGEAKKENKNAMDVIMKVRPLLGHREHWIPLMRSLCL